MDLAKLKATLRAELGAVRTWINLAVGFALAYPDVVVAAVNDNLPALTPYLPENLVKVLGFVVVVYNIAHSVNKTHQSQ